MSRHKSPPLSARNWDALTEQNDLDIPMFEKVRAVSKEPGINDAKQGRERSKQNFHRTRFSS